MPFIVLEQNQRQQTNLCFVNIFTLGLGLENGAFAVVCQCATLLHAFSRNASFCRLNCVSSALHSDSSIFVMRFSAFIRFECVLFWAAWKAAIIGFGAKHLCKCSRIRVSCISTMKRYRLNESCSSYFITTFCPKSIVETFRILHLSNTIKIQFDIIFGRKFHLWFHSVDF